MSSGRINARNLLANWTGHGANMVVLFFLSPFIVHTLGTTLHGVWSLLTILTGYMGILDLGVRASTGRHVTLYIGKDDHKAVDETIRTSMTFFTSVGMVIVAVGVLLGFVFPYVFRSVPVEYHTLVRVLLPILALNMWITALRTVVSTVLIANDRFDITNGIDLVLLAIRAGGTVYVLKAGMGLLGLTVVVVGCNLVGLALAWVVAKRVYPALRLWPLFVSKPRMRELLGYGAAAFVSAIAFKIIGQTDVIIAGAVFSTKFASIYSVGAMMVFYSATFIRQISGTFFQPVQRAVARGEKGSVKWLFSRQVRLGMLFGLPMYIGFMMFAEPFIRLWMFHPETFPKSFVDMSVKVMIILSASKLLYLVTIGSDGLLAASGRIRGNAVVAITESVLNLVLSLVFVLVLDWGLAGIAAGTLVSLAFVRTFIQPARACKVMGVSMIGFLTGVVVPGVVTGGVFAGICLLIRRCVQIKSWGMFAAMAALAVVLYIPVALVLLVPKDDRRRVLGKLAKLRPAARSHEKQ